MDGHDADSSKQSTADMTIFVQNLLQQMQTRFQSMSESIISKIDEIGNRIDGLEHSINDLRAEMGQKGSSSPSATLKAKEEPKSGQPAMGLDDDLEELIGATRKSTSEEVILKKKFVSTSGDQHMTGRSPVGSCSSDSFVVPSRSMSFRKRALDDPVGSCSSDSFVSPSRSKSFRKRALDKAEVEMSGDTPVADSKRARVAGEESQYVHALTLGKVNLLEMFNLMFQLSPPPASILNKTTDYVGKQFAHSLSQVASTSAELFVRARRSAEELKKLNEVLKEQDAQLRSLRQYPGSDQFLQDAIAHFASRQADLPALVSSLCSSEDAALPMFQALRRDPVGLKMLRRVTAWGYHQGKRAM